MRINRLQLMALSSCAVVLTAIFWTATLPDHNQLQVIPDEQAPLGSPQSAASEYDSGYGVLWVPSPDQSPGVFIGYSDGQPVAKLTTLGSRDSEETVSPGMNRQDAEKILGEPLTTFNRTRIASLSGSGKAFYNLGNDLVILYFDNVADDQVVFVLRINNELAVRSRFFTSSELEPFTVEGMESMTIALMNAVRAQYQKSEVQPDPQLTLVARGHSNAMAEQNFFSHDTPSGQTMKDRLKAAGIKSRGAGEALTAGTWTPMDAIMAWMNSPPHREILLGDYDTGGVGVAVGNSGYGIYYTLNVIRN